MRSAVALGREFWFPFDTELLESPTLKSSNNEALFKYLRDVSKNSTFTTAVLQIIVEERLTDHCKQWRNGKENQLFQVRDTVKAHVKFQSKSDKG